MSKKRGKRTASADAKAPRAKRDQPVVAEAAIEQRDAADAVVEQHDAWVVSEAEVEQHEAPFVPVAETEQQEAQVVVEAEAAGEVPVATPTVVTVAHVRIARSPGGPTDAYALLADYDRLSLAHDPGVPEQIEAPGLWRAIGFRVGDHDFVSGIDEISEILMAPPPVTSIPATRPWLLGVANVRGNLIALVDLKQFLFEKRTHVTARARVLVVRQSGGNVGLLVDQLLGQRNLTDADRAGAEGEGDPVLARYVTENVTVGGTRLGRFSMVDLTRAPEFVHAAT